MYLFNDLKFNHSSQRTIGDVQYPAGWFHDPLERAKIGVIEVPDPVVPDDNLYTSVENPDGSYTATPRTAADLAERLAATAFATRSQRDQLLASCDWRVIKAFEAGTTTPTDWATYRQALRDVTSQAGFPSAVEWPEQP
jgi:hypothetical protein